jgi:hypothetical protein
MAEDSEEICSEQDAYIRLECLRIASTLHPKAADEKLIERAMVFEWYVRGEIPPDLSGRGMH